MIKYLLLFAFTLFSSLNALSDSSSDVDTDDDKKSSESNGLEYFKRLRESAHPLPVEPYLPYSGKGSYNLKMGSLAIEGEYKLPKFVDTTTTIDGPGSGNHQNESSIAVSPTNPDFLIGSAVDYRESGSTWIYMSRDGGVTWENRSLGKPFPTWRSTNDPSVHFDSKGTAYLMYGAFPGQGASSDTDGQNGVFISKSTDEGQTWETHKPVILHDQPMTPDSTFEDKYYIHIDNSPDSPFEGNIYTPWKRVTPRDSATQIVFTRSEDGGDAWSTPVNISKRMAGSSEDTTFGQSFPLVTTDSKGNLYAVWNNGIEHGIGFNRSSDAGLTWGEDKIVHNYDIFGITKELGQGWRHTVKGTVRAEAYPVVEVNLAEGPYKDDVYLIWAADNIPNIYFSKSTDMGDTWSTPIIIHETEENDQWWPWLGVDPESGDIGVMYLDSRNDPENILTECYVSYSQDGGETWIDRKASSAPFDVRNNPFADRAFAGDYSGLDFRNGIIYPSWVDMRNEDSPSGWDSDVYTAIMDTKNPSPAENFVAATLPSQPDKVALSWEPVLETTFGKDIESTALRYEIYRDETLVNIVPSAITELEDTTPAPFTEHTYTIAALYDDRKSIKRVDKGYAGGAKEPLPPVLSQSQRHQAAGFAIDAYIPSLRRDSVTPLVNAEQLDFYLDGELFEQISLMPTDTATTIDLTGEITEPGYYQADAILIADFTELGFGKQQSPRSNQEVFAVGSLESYYFAEENPESRLVMIDPSWKVNTDHITSSIQSIAIGYPEKYASLDTASILMPPIMLDGSPKYLHFNHILQVTSNETTEVQYSTDLQNWETVKSFSSNDKESWKDLAITPDDWQTENIRIDEFGTSGEVIFVRLYFKSDNFLERGEWIVDNLQIDGTLTSIAERGSTEQPLRAVFSNGEIGLYNSGDRLQIHTATLFDMSGRTIVSQNDIDFPEGAYQSIFTARKLGSISDGIYRIVCQIEGSVVSVSLVVNN